MHLREYAHHHLATTALLLFSAWVSLTLIISHWVKHRGDSLAKRILWTLVLIVPFFGWLLYGAFYTPLSENDVTAPVNSDAFSGGH